MLVGFQAFLRIVQDFVIIKMKVLFENWRKYKSGVLLEVAKGPRNLPDSVYLGIFELNNPSEEVVFYYCDVDGNRLKKRNDIDGGGWKSEGRPVLATKEEPTGTLIISPAEDEYDGKCLGAYVIGWAGADQGWGPMLYDIAIEYASKNGGGLISDRASLSAEAFNVWDYYMKKRADVDRAQLDDRRGTLTPNFKMDDCNQGITFDILGYDMYDGGDIYQTYSQWDLLNDKPEKYKRELLDSPISKVYVKNPTVTNSLAQMGKLIVNGKVIGTEQ